MADLLDSRYVSTFRVDYATFNWLLQQCEDDIQRMTTRFRSPIPAAKKLGITLEWLANGLTEAHLADQYCVGQATVHKIVHEVVSVLCEKLIADSIKFPTGAQLENVMANFEAASRLKRCAGSFDGTFMKIRKPTEWGDAYWCYKDYCAILILAVVDCDGYFTYVDAGRAGSLGDAYTYNHSTLKAKIDRGEWLRGTAEWVGDVQVKPYLVADSAFALSTTLMKGYDYPPAPGHQRSFNAAVVKARRAVETAFGKLKGRFHILVNNFINDPAFAQDIAVLCCALHNICQRAQCEFQDSWLAPDQGDDEVAEPEDEEAVHVDGAAMMRLRLAESVHGYVPQP